MARIAGLCHDLGKATGYFQQKLKGIECKASLSRHSLLSAICSYFQAMEFLRQGHTDEEESKWLACSS